MNWLRTFSIRARLLACMALVVFIGMAIGARTTIDLFQLRSGFDGLTKGELALIAEMNQVATTVSLMRGAEKDMIIHAGDTVAIGKQRQLWQVASNEARKSIQEVLTAFPDPQVQHAMDSVQKHFDAYTHALSPVVKLLENGTLRAASEALASTENARLELVSAERILMESTQNAKAAAELRRADISSQIDRSVIMLWALLWSPGIIFLPLMWASIISVVQPLRHAEDVVVAIAHGDLTQRINTSGNDEIARLLGAMNSMQTGLTEMVDAIRRSSADMLVASTQIAAGNQDLSSRTEMAAGHLQQTTVSVENLNENVHESTKAAHSASALAANARTQAENGGKVVTEAVANMDQISDASRKISDIIGVIDGIAFQTNILALNAAVEAARAGEQGRGFAVVASEVRSLAQRSASAAKEIKTLIGASTERVEAGSQRVRDAGAVMQGIVESIRSVTDAMAGIAAAANQQSEGLSSVAESVTSLDHMTQQNAALVQQSAAAAGSLKSQADGLAHIVQRFHIAQPG